ncbi:MAG: hypothetical protein ACI840_001990, partial [Ulvibacter sp.]
PKTDRVSKCEQGIHLFEFYNPLTSRPFFENPAN